MAGISPRDRSRSPRFPNYPLSEAVSYAQRIYEGVHRSAIDASTAFRLMGFSGRSGASATALGAIRQFGLIAGISDNTRISELALRILEPASVFERSEALKLAAREPEVFRSILDRFDGRIPTADEPVRAFLIRELGFSKGGAEDCLASLRKTIEFIDELGDYPMPALIPDGDDPEETEAKPDKPNFSSSGFSKSNDKASYRIPLTRDCVAELNFSGDLSEKAINRLIMHIELMREVWTED
jgi:hypothetical protein